MAEVKLKFTKQFFVKLLTIKSEGFFAGLSLFIKNRIQSFTRTGKSLVTGQRLKALSPKYIATRKTEAFKREADKDFFAPTRSNLTATGQLLKSLVSKIEPDKMKITISVEGERINGGINNKKVADFVAEGGRPFLGLDPAGTKRVVTEVQRELRRRLKRFKK